MNNLIDIRGVSFSYGSIPVLQDINLQITDGEFFGIIGPNASGKTTLLRLMLGLARPDTGTIHILGMDPVQARTKIGYVPQHPTFRRDFPISVVDVVRTGQAGMHQQGLDARLQEALAAVEIEAIAARPIAALSGGQLQRVMIARALACAPEILILDEPTASIDLRVEEDIFTVLKRYSERMTIVVVSHDIAFISAYVQRVGCLNRTLVCHRTDEISGKTIEDLYGAPVKIIHHHH